MKRVVAFTRVSTRKQDEGASLTTLVDIKENIKIIGSDLKEHINQTTGKR